MKIQFIKLSSVIALATWLTGCMINPAPNSGYYAMTPEQTREVQRVTQDTKNADRAERKEYMMDEAEVRAWESRNSRPVNHVIVTRPVYY